LIVSNKVASLVFTLLLRVILLIATSINSLTQNLVELLVHAIFLLPSATDSTTLVQTVACMLLHVIDMLVVKIINSLAQVIVGLLLHEIGMLVTTSITTLAKITLGLL
jgi:hypothetical protein